MLIKIKIYNNHWEDNVNNNRNRDNGGDISFTDR